MIHPQLRAAPPPLIEVVLVGGVTLFTVVLAAIVGESTIAPAVWRSLAPWVSHLPMLVIPWVWYRLRVSPCLPAEHRGLSRWTSGSVRLLLAMAVLLVGANLAWNWDAVAGGWIPVWARGSWESKLSGFLFQGVMVGLSEEMAFRPAFHLPLRMRLQGGMRLGPLELSWAAILTAVAFGSIHLVNAFFGRSWASALSQSVSACLGAACLGWYYERTGNYLGTALLHNLVDLSIPAVLLIRLSLV